MHSSLVSVIMSVYNTNNDFLVKSIESILNQTYRNIEFLIFDDCTSDENKKVLKTFAEKDKRVILYINDKNQGLTANLIYAVQQARGKYICRQDADDISLKGRIEQEYRFLEKNPDVVMVGTNMWIKEGNSLSKRNKYIQNYKYIRTRLFFENCIMHSSIMMRTDLLHDNNLNYNLSFKKAQDYDLWVRLSDYGKIVVLNDRLCISRVHKNQISKKYELEQKEYYLTTAVSQLKYIGLLSDDTDIRLHKKFLSVDTSDLKETIEWSIKLIKAEKPSNMWSLYFNIYVIKRIARLVVKKLIKG